MLFENLSISTCTYCAFKIKFNVDIEVLFKKIFFPHNFEAFTVFFLD